LSSRVSHAAGEALTLLAAIEQHSLFGKKGGEKLWSKQTARPFSLQIAGLVA